MWYRKAAEQNYVRAQINLATRYARGEGVEKSYIEAYAWYEIALQSSDSAKGHRDELERIMSTQEIAEAQRRTKELRSLIDSKLKEGRRRVE